MKPERKIVLEGDLGWREKPTSETAYTPEDLANYLERHLPSGWGVKSFRVVGVPLKPVSPKKKKGAS